ncbi:MAG: class 1 fructose-bisphosphatase [Pseudomonadota bacterium]
MHSIDLDEWLQTQPPALAVTITALARAAARIAEAVSLGALAGLHGAEDSSNSHGEVQQRLDLFADRCMAEALAVCPSVAGWASEEQESPVVSADYARSGDHLVLYDPLDGSSNVEINSGIGTIFSVLPHPFRGTHPGAAGFLQPGQRQVAAGYVLYGAATVMALTTGAGVAMFTLDRRSGRWCLTRDQVRLPAGTAEFAINCSNQRFWEKPVQRYIAECLAGEDGPRARNFNMRWVACLVSEVHRILSRGGVFLYPRDHKQPLKPGRLRLMYEAAPMALLIEQAGGGAVTGTQDLLQVVPDTLHQRVPVILGTAEEVQRIVRYHAEPSENVTWQLFKTRSLYVQPQA